MIKLNYTNNTKKVSCEPRYLYPSYFHKSRQESHGKGGGQKEDSKWRP